MVDDPEIFPLLQMLKNSAVELRNAQLEFAKANHPVTHEKRWSVVEKARRELVAVAMELAEHIPDFPIT